MKRANEALERERADGSLGERDIERLDDEGPYIEMNLGLGVLEEKREEGGSKSGSGSEGGDEESESDGDSSDEEPETKVQRRERGPEVKMEDCSVPGHCRPKTRRKERDAMRQLKGQEKIRVKPSIQVL